MPKPEKKKTEFRWRKLAFICNKCETLFQIEIPSNLSYDKVTCPMCQAAEVTKRF